MCLVHLVMPANTYFKNTIVCTLRDISHLLHTISIPQTTCGSIDIMASLQLIFYIFSHTLLTTTFYGFRQDYSQRFTAHVLISSGCTTLGMLGNTVDMGRHAV